MQVIFSVFERKTETQTIEQWVYKLFTYMGMDRLTKDHDKDNYDVEWEKIKSYLGKFKNMFKVAECMEIDYKG